MKKTINITCSGLGGQGVLTATDLLAEVLFRAGFDVKKSEVHGMSQRGGSVSSEVRYGEEVCSPMIPAGETDVLAVFDLTQIENNLSKLKQGGVLITPDDVPLDKLENPKALNMMIAGAVSVHIPEVPEERFLETIRAIFPAKFSEGNVRAFQLGRAGK